MATGLFNKFSSLETLVRANFATLDEVISADEEVIHRLETKIALLEQEAHSKHDQLGKQLDLLTKTVASNSAKLEKTALAIGEFSWRFKRESVK